MDEERSISQAAIRKVAYASHSLGSVTQPSNSGLPRKTTLNCEMWTVVPHTAESMCTRNQHTTLKLCLLTQCTMFSEVSTH